MALLNEIQTGRVNAILHKMFDMKEGAPAPQLSGDVVATIALEQDRPEWEFLGGGRLCAGNTDLAAQAGELGAIALWNPAGSNTLLVLEQVVVGNFSASLINQGWITTALSSGGQHAFRDSRSGIESTSATGQVTYQTAAGVSIQTIVLKHACGSVGINSLLAPVVISPGFGWSVVDTAANQRHTVNFFWRERQLEPSETR